MTEVTLRITSLLSNCLWKLNENLAGKCILLHTFYTGETRLFLPFSYSDVSAFSQEL